MAFDDSTTNLVNIEAFFDRLARHDWYFECSDCPGTYRAGYNEHEALEVIARQSPEHRNLFDAYARYVMADGPQPERPSASTLPNLETSALADMLGEAEAHTKAAVAEVEKLKAEIKRRGISQAAGQKFAILVTCSQRHALDTAAIRREMPAAWIAAHSRSSASTTISVRAAPRRAKVRGDAAQ